MFIKNNKVSCLIICTSMFDDEEIRYLKREFAGLFSVVFFIPYDEEIPAPLGSGDLIVKEKFMDRCFTYERVLKKIVTLTNIPSNECVFISKNIEFIKRVLYQPVGTVWVSDGSLSYDVIGHLPDKKVSHIEELKDALEVKHGYFSEVCTTILSSNQSYNDSGVIFSFEMSRENIKFNVISAGRYFGPKHECFNSHQLSQRIKKSKYSESQNKLFANIYVPIVNHLNNITKVDGVTRVPSRPGKADRLKPIVKYIVKNTLFEDLSEKIICPNNYPPHKGLSKERRFENVKNKFFVEGDFTDKHIVIIDDVFTTGATVYECAKQFYLARASKVTVVVLGVNQFSNEFMVQRYAKCPECGEKLLLRINNYNNVAFYGCENYCGFTEDFLLGWHRIIEENSINAVQEEHQEDCLF
jgi:predicted amidophosphoribosyltransferase